jgi:hypothetical protein
MGNESTAYGGDSDEALDVECNTICEYGFALANAAEECLRYPDRMRNAKTRAERDSIRAAHRRFLRVTIGSNTLALAVLDGESSVEGNGG